MNAESEASQMMIDTDKWLLSEQERQQLRLANARLVLEKNQLRDMVNRWQGLSMSALGNIQRCAKEMQEHLKTIV